MRTNEKRYVGRRERFKMQRKARFRARLKKLVLCAIVFCIVSMVAVTGLVYTLTEKTETSEITLNSECDVSKIYADLFGEMDVSWWFKASGEVNTRKTGQYRVIYEPRFFFGKTLERIFVVVDDEKPELTLFPMESEEPLASIDDFVDPGYEAYDNYDGNITNKVVVTINKFEPNWYEVCYQVADSSGNVTTARRKVNVVSGTVCLTFDDGPSFLTPQFLDILNNYGVKATFFVVGFEDKDKDEIIKREYQEGHTIGYHGYSHEYSEIYTSLDNLMSNFYRIEIKITNLTGAESSKIIRFPGGTSNTVSRRYCRGIMSAAVERVQEEGYVYFDWNVDSQDAGGANTPEEIYANVIAGLRTGRLNVVLMHDASTKENTLQALPWIIEYCQENDYAFEALSTSSRQIFHKAQN